MDFNMKEFKCKPPGTCDKCTKSDGYSDEMFSLYQYEGKLCENFIKIHFFTQKNHGDCESNC